MRPRLRPKSLEMLQKRDKRKNKRQHKRLNSNLMKLSIKLNLIGSLPLRPNKKLKMPRTSIELKRDLKLMLRELRPKTEKERLKREKEELKKLLKKPKLRLESKGNELLLRKLKRSWLPFKREMTRLPLLLPRPLGKMLKSKGKLQWPKLEPKRPKELKLQLKPKFRRLLRNSKRQKPQKPLLGKLKKIELRKNKD